MKNTTAKVAGFAIYDKQTGRVLTALPLTIPIGQTVDGFNRAGCNVGWAWVELDLPQVTA